MKKLLVAIALFVACGGKPSDTEVKRKVGDPWRDVSGYTIEIGGQLNPAVSGQDAPLGAMYRQELTGSVQRWIKTGSTDTSWIKMLQDGQQYAIGANTLYVAKSWPTGTDPTHYFTTLGAAETQAATLLPTASNLVTIYMSPGIYTENVTLVSNVTVIGAGINSTQIDGTMSWVAGSGVNAPQAAGAEFVDLMFLSNAVSSSDALTVDTTAKSGGSANLACTRCILSNATITGRANGSDTMFFYDNVFPFGANTPTFTNVTGPANPNAEGIVIVGSRFRGLAFAGTTTARIQGGEQNFRSGSTIALSGAGCIVYAQGLDIVNPVSAVSGAQFIAGGDFLASTATVTGAGTFDFRGSSLGGNANITGISGTANRTTWTGTTSATSAGANTITLSPAYPDGSYTVDLQLVSGAGNAAATVTSKSGSGFTLTDSVGTNVWDYVVTHN